MQAKLSKKTALAKASCGIGNISTAGIAISGTEMPGMEPYKMFVTTKAMIVPRIATVYPIKDALFADDIGLANISASADIVIPHPTYTNN